MLQKQTPQLVIATDIGGTKLLVALVSEDGVIHARERMPTDADKGPEAVVSNLFTAIDRMLEHTELTNLKGISVSAAGGIDAEKGIVTKSPNLPGWHNVPLRDMVQKKYGIPTYLINDAGAAALGEHRFGAAKGLKHVIMLTVGTGIGGGIIINGELYRGAVGSAGEIGHMTIDIHGPPCKCGNIGDLETLASGTAMEREAKLRLMRGEPSVLREMAGGELKYITGKEIGEAARQGDALALSVVRQIAELFGVGLVNLVNIFNPQMIVVGGGVATLGELLLGPARKLVNERAFPVSAQAVRIVPAQLGNEAGVLGAAAWAFEN